jgi:hypothetical protein
MTSTGKLVTIVIAASACIVLVWALIRTARPLAGVRRLLDTQLGFTVGPRTDPGTLYYRDYPRRLSLNVPALILGPVWYLLAGLWAHASILIALVGLTGGLLAPVVWVYCGLKANEDLLEFRIARDSVY